MPRRTLCALASALSLFLAACGGSGSAPEEADTRTFVVDALSGSDSNPGDTVKPFATLTHALAAAGPGATIHVRPGLYDEAHGERFPLQLLLGQRVIGNADARGLGPQPTVIAGEGQTAYNVSATLLMAHGSWLVGFEIRGASNPSFHYGIVLHGVNAHVENNTFAGPMYGGVYAQHPAGSRIERNDFYTTAYGAYLTAAAGRLNVSHNRFHTPARGIRIDDADENVRIDANAFLGQNQIGVSVEAGRPRLRRNTFAAPYAVEVHGGAPDLGTPADPGRNDFSGTSRTVINHGGAATLPAVGNTWPGQAPAAGGQIQVGGAGTVVWGTEAEQRVSALSPFAAR
ncbi:MAG: DUF1565 domain-containing protein [Planctomycetota bacterium]|nr:DUF1565 domain-containing protein [Planctomycetota bacterium]